MNQWKGKSPKNTTIYIKKYSLRFSDQRDEIVASLKNVRNAYTIRNSASEMTRRSHSDLWINMQN